MYRQTDMHTAYIHVQTDGHAYSIRGSQYRNFDMHTAYIHVGTDGHAYNIHNNKLYN